MNDSHDFDALAREFRGIDAPSEALLRAVEKGRRRLVRGMILGGVLSVLLPAVGIFVLWKDRDAPAAVFAAMQIGVPITVMLFAYRSQRNAWSAQSQTTCGFLDLQIERYRDLIRRMRFLLRWLAPAIVACVVLSQFLQLRKAPPGPVPVGYVGPYVICGLIAWVALRKKARFEREEARLSRERAELEDGGIP
jgi:hypothetical protein